MKGSYLIILLICSCNKSRIAFDKIQLITYTDTSIIKFIVTNDSTIVLQLKMGDCDPYYGCNYGPKYYAEIAKHIMIFPSVYNEIQSVLSDTFHLERIMVTHAATSNLKFLLQDSVLKSFNFYGLEDNCKDILEIKNQIIKIISQVNRSKIKITERLLDISSLKFLDSIIINKLKSPEIYGTSLTHRNYNNEHAVKIIKSKVQIDSFLNILQNLIILDSTGSEMLEQFSPKYEFYFFKNGLVSLQLQTDLNIIPFDWPQTLKVDSNIIKQIY